MATYKDVISGLELFASKVGSDKHLPGADHDVIFGPSLDVSLTEEEQAKLEMWGWAKDGQYDCWRRFA